MITIRFMSLVGKFAEVRKETFPTTQLALEAVKAHAATAGYTNVKIADNADFAHCIISHVRYTARTPGGRGGRNIAFGDYECEEDAPW